MTCQTDYYGIITSLDVDINVSEFNSNSTIFSKKGNFKLTADNTKIDAADWQYGIYTPNGCFESYIKNGGLISGKTAIYSFQAPYIVADDLEITSAEGDGIWSRSNSHMIGDPTSDTHGIYIKGDNITINAGSDKEADGIEGMSAKLLGGKIRINATEGKNSRGIYLHSTKSSYAEILSPLTIESMGTGIDIENELSTDEMTFSNALTVTSNLFIDSENGYGFRTRTTYDKIVNSDCALRALFTSEFGLLKGGKGTYDSATDLPSQLTKNDRCTLLENSATTLIWVQNTSTSTTDEDGTEVPNYNKGEYIVGEHLPSPVIENKIYNVGDTATVSYEMPLTAEAPTLTWYIYNPATDFSTEITDDEVSFEGLYGTDDIYVTEAMAKQYIFVAFSYEFAGNRVYFYSNKVKVKSNAALTVSFDSNGGSGTMDSISSTEESEYTIPECGFEAPEGKYFGGWEYRSDSGDNYTVYPGNTVILNGDTTLTAIWTETDSSVILFEDFQNDSWYDRWTTYGDYKSFSWYMDGDEYSVAAGFDGED